MIDYINSLLFLKNMEPIKFEYTLKYIPTSNIHEYKIKCIEKLENVIKI